MPQLPLKAFAKLAQEMAGAADDEILQAARALGGELGAAAKKSVQQILESGEDFGILSAANPGRALSPEENLARHSTLMSRVKEMGFEPLEQRGVYGGAEEPSLLVPGLGADDAKALGREFEQEAVISARGWHRLADDAEFPRTSLAFPEQVDDYYSEIVDPVSGQPRRYQLGFPDEAFEKATARTLTERKMSLPSGLHYGSLEEFIPDGPPDQFGFQRYRVVARNDGDAHVVKAQEPSDNVLMLEQDSDWDGFTGGIQDLENILSTDPNALDSYSSVRYTHPTTGELMALARPGQPLGSRLATPEEFKQAYLESALKTVDQAIRLKNPANLRQLREEVGPEQLDRLLASRGVSLQTRPEPGGEMEYFAPRQAPSAAPTEALEAPLQSGLDQIAEPSPQVDFTPSQAPAIIRATPELVKGLGPLAKSLRKTNEPGIYELTPEVHQRVQQLFEIGHKLPRQSDWTGGENEELIAAVGGSEDAARLWARLFGATSPGTSVPVNTRESLSAFRHHLVNPAQPMSLNRARSMDPVITMAGSKVPSINNAYHDLPLTKPKPEELAKLMVGKEPGTPLDIHAIAGMGSKKKTFDQEISGLRKMMTEAEGLPARGGLTNEQIYYRTADALTRALNDIAPEMPHNPRFATYWEGVRAAKGLKHQGGPIDILRKKGLLKEAAMLDPGKLRDVLKSAGWTAGAITAVLKATSVEAAEQGIDIKKLQREADTKRFRESRDPNYPSEPRLNDEPYRSPRASTGQPSRNLDINLPAERGKPGAGSSRAKTAAPMNARVYHPKSD